MKRLLMAVVIAGLAVACGDDDGGDDDGTSRPDAGDAGRDAAADGGIDASTDAGGDSGAATPKVTNVLATCATASTCTGGSPICQPALPFVMGRYPGGGACTAACTADSDCGPGGICPVGRAIAQFGSTAVSPGVTVAQALGGTGYCSKGCSLTDQTSCGAGYACVNIAILGQRTAPPDAGPNPAAGIPPFNTPFCIPIIPLGDGGVGDGGTTRVDGGMDGGV